MRAEAPRVNPGNTQDAHKPTHCERYRLPYFNACAILQGCTLLHFFCLWNFSIYILKTYSVISNVFQHPASKCQEVHETSVLLSMHLDTAKACRRGYYWHLELLLQCFQTSLQFPKLKLGQRSWRFEENGPKSTFTVIQAQRRQL